MTIRPDIPTFLNTENINNDDLTEKYKELANIKLEIAKIQRNNEKQRAEIIELEKENLILEIKRKKQMIENDKEEFLIKKRMLLTMK